MTLRAAPPPAPPFLALRGVHKSFGATEVLRGLDLDIARGEKVALIGASGSGKSTLLRLLMMLDRPTAGRIEIEGCSLFDEVFRGRTVPAGEAHLQRLRRRFGLVFQHFHLFPHLKALDNVALALVLVGGQSRRAARERARALLAQVGLAEKAGAWPAQLSGGQKQRVAIARALALEPDVLLFDEPTSALDPERVGEVLGVLRRLARDSSATLLLATHEMAFAAEIADRVVFLHAGRVHEQGPPERIFRRPERARTRAFLQQVLSAAPWDREPGA